MLNQTLNKTDAFTLRLNTTKNSLEKDDEFKFKTRKSFYNKQNEKLWTLIDQYKAQKQVEKEDLEERAQLELVEKFKKNIKRQMQESDLKKRDGKVEVRKDRDDIEEKMALYRKD